MPKAIRNHFDSLKSVCVICFYKGRDLQNVSENVENMIKTNIFPSYDRFSDTQPNVICSSCRKKLSSNDFENLPIFDRDKIRVPRKTRGAAAATDFCDCTICEIARTTINSKSPCQKLSKGRPTSTTIDDGDSPANLKICTHCFCQIGRGKPHVCSKTKKFTNLTGLIASQSSDDPEKFCASTIAAKLHSKSGNIDLHKVKSGSVSISLNSPQHQLTSETMRDIQRDMNLSGRQTSHLAKTIRQSNRRSSVEPYMREYLRDSDHILDDHFHSIYLDFIDSRNARIQRPVILCKNVQIFIDDVISRRQVVTDHLIKIGIDGGKGFLKINLQIIENDTSNATASSVNGVKSMFLIAIVPDLPENYTNLKYLWHHLGLANLTSNFIIAADMKVCNMLLGLMSSGSSHPCPWCDVNKNELINAGQSRTWGTLSSLFWQFYDSAETKSHAKNYGNVIHPSIIHGNSNDRVLETIPPPELHLLTGSVSKLMQILEDTSPNIANQYLNQSHVIKDPYHGGSLTGNSARKLLQNVDQLRAIATIDVLPIVSAFKSLDNVVTSCFGKHLDANYSQHIEKFKDDLIVLNVTISPKLHTIIHHVPEFCGTKNESLGRYSEQISETLHADFESFWLNYKVKNLLNPKYVDQLLAAVRAYNGRHL